MSKKYQITAREIFRSVAKIFEARGLEFPVNNLFLKTSPTGVHWLLIMFDWQKVSRIQQLSDPDLIHHLNLELKKFRLFPVSDGSGQYFSYAIALDPRPELPKIITSSEQLDDKFQIGLDIMGREISTTWKDLGHVIVAGMTGSGKSVFMRSITNQAIHDGFKLALIDLEDRTFSSLITHPQLMAPIGGLSNAEQVLDSVIAEIERRKKLFVYGSSIEDVYDWNRKYPAKKLPLILLAIDEYNATVQTFGGIRSDFATKSTLVAWRGRKYGVVMVIAGQTFEKAIVGAVRDQMVTKICFRVANSVVSRVILEKNGAEKLDTPGRAITNKWGLIQTYYVESFDQAETEFKIEQILTDMEIELVKSVLKYNDGKLTYEYITSLGWSRSDAKTLRDRLVELSLAETDKNQNNSLVLNIPKEIEENLRGRKSLQT